MQDKYTKNRPFITTFRDVFKSRTWKNHNGFRLYMWCLNKANVTTEDVYLETPNGFIAVTVYPGTFITGRRSGSAETGIKPTPWYRGMKFLEKEKRIMLKPNNQYTLVTICDTELLKPLYDASEQRMNSGRTANEHNMIMIDNEENSIDHGFQDFYDQYHQKTGKPKKGRVPSLREWKKLSQTDKALAIEKIPDYAQTNEPKYLKLAQNYLKDKVFTDEMRPMKKNKNTLSDGLCQ